MIGEECVLKLFQGLESRGQGLNLQSQGQGIDSQGRDHRLENCPRGRGLVLEDSKTANNKTICQLIKNLVSIDKSLGAF